MTGRPFICVYALVTAVVCVAGLACCRQQGPPAVLFYSDPQQSDNDIIRRTDPAVLSPAETHFADMTRGLFEVTVTQDPAEVTREKLKGYRAVVFFTAINPPADKEALVEWVKNGGGFVGIHSTANTFQGYPPFGEMLGANFDRRPWRTRDQPLARARVIVADPRHAATRHLAAAFEIEDDLYVFKNWDRRNVHLLLRLDPASLDMSKVQQPDEELPVAWTRTYGRGRVFYTALGDAVQVWQDPRFRRHLIEGLKWTMRE
ncbi:MAG: hypothetical protein AMXMBFR83_02370 [Phycisphaerae bacterium]